MKLRFRKNSLRLRLNQVEVQALASGQVLEESVVFPGAEKLSYILRTQAEPDAEATFAGGVITVDTPLQDVQRWSGSDEIGMYFDLPSNGSALRIAIEKDLACVDGPPEELDPDAFPRSSILC